MAMVLTNNGLFQGNAPVMVNQAGFLHDLVGSTVLGVPNALGVDGNPLTAAVNTVKDTTSAAATAGKAVIATAAWVSDRDNWLRIIKVLIGCAFIIEGIMMLVSKPLMSPQAVAAIATVAK